MMGSIDTVFPFSNPGCCAPIIKCWKGSKRKLDKRKWMMEQIENLDMFLCGSLTKKKTILSEEI